MGYKIHRTQAGVDPGYVRYLFEYRFQGQRHRKLVTCRRSAAEGMYRHWENDILRSITKDYMLFEIIDLYLADVQTHKSETYCKQEVRVLERVKDFIRKDIPIGEFRRKHVAEYITWRRGKVFSQYDNSKEKGKVSPGTINRDIAVISSFFNWAIRREYYQSVNPASMSKLKENNIQEVQLSGDQITELIHKAYDTSETMGHVISIALMTGMRKREILSLEWREISFDASRIMLSATKTKSKKARMIPLIGGLRDILLEIKRSSKSPLVFQGYTQNILYRQWKKLLKAIDFAVMPSGQPLLFHSLRHVYAQSLLDQGVQLEDIQSLLGHEDIKTTQKRYAMFARPDLQEKAEKISKVVQFKRVV